MDAHTYTKHAENSLNKRLPDWKLMATVFWDRKGVLMVEFMQQGSTTMSEVYCETKKTAAGHSEQRAWNADIRYSAPPSQCASAYSCSHSSTAGAVQLGVVWPLSLQPRSRSERLHLFTYPNKWLWLQRFNNNDEFMESVKTWLSSQAAGFLTRAHKNLFPDTTRASVPGVTTLRSSLIMHAFFCM
jgi:hypothetical protein